MVDRPNILVLCMDQWDMHMDLPEGVELPTLRRLETEGVTLEKHYCTVAICTPSRTTMWTGQHAKTLGMWDNTNFAWIKPLSPDVPTLGDMMREQGYYTAFKGKWHLSGVPAYTNDALEDYGFSDYQSWGDMFGAPYQGLQLDGTVAMETVDWLQHKAPKDQPWLLVSSLVNPHDIMYLQEEGEEAHENAMMGHHLHPTQNVQFMQEWWDPSLPENIHDDLSQQPLGPKSYKDFIDMNYTRVPEGRDDLWKNRRNYLINAMRLVDSEFGKIVDELDRQGLWENTVVIFTSDHGEMNGAHQMHQKGGIHFEEATVVNMTAIVPGGRRGVKTSNVGSHVDLVPTLLSFAGVSDDERAAKYPQLPGRDLSAVMTDPDKAESPRGTTEEPGDGALIMWDGLHQQDPQWGITGAMRSLLDLPLDDEIRAEELRKAGAEFGAPDFTKRTFFRAVVDGRHKMVRWFSPLEYGAPTSVDELYETSDVSLHDLVEDPQEMENLGNPEHPRHDRELVERLMKKLNALIERELGEDPCPFDLDMFGTRDVTYDG